MTNTAPHKSPILVTGGTGKTGRRVAERLAALGHGTRVGSPSGATRFLWEDRGTWAPALEGAGAAYVAYFPDLSFPGAAETVGAFSQSAVEHGTRRLVLLSGRGEEGARASEDAMRASGADVTVLRCSWFDQNFSESFFLPAVLDGEIALPTGDAVEPFVDVDDIADVAVAALTDDRHTGATYELSGPRAIGFAEVAAELSSATGRTIAYKPVDMEDYRAALSAAGQPPEFADLFELIRDGRNAEPVDGVRTVLGRAPRDFAAYARDAAKTGVWNA
ncbi:NmrA family transcriptional regulator [Streptomyces sp. NPDC050560]|uniref:NmrA family transcriptional regulator n=1 Tax=Streptomyces sp. NPDC050560 TaxID=3365630 RepID=UPI00379EDA67